MHIFLALKKNLRQTCLSPYRALTALLLIGGSLLPGCATYYSPSSQPASQKEQGVQPPPDFRPGRRQTQETPSPRSEYTADSRPSQRSNTVHSIYRQAHQAYQHARWDTVIQLAERGLRVQRQEASFYWLLAESYDAKGNPSQAREFARLGLIYAPTSAHFRSRLQHLSQP